MLSSVGRDGRLPLIGIGERTLSLGVKRQKIGRLRQLALSNDRYVASRRPDTSPWPGDKLLEVKLNDQERRVVGRLLTERKALLIETTEDTTQPDPARRAGSIELSVIESILGKLCLRDLASTGAADLLQRRR